MDAEKTKMLDFIRNIAMSNTVFKPYARKLLTELGYEVKYKKVTGDT
jgi:hypothetical protein